LDAIPMWGGWLLRFCFSL